ncbi:MAG: 30S ribosomal protein S3 [Candidatus Omnitrophota bacterium]|nr:MAG: 30S ribosomal protein S3 [Candidatus Omnitrophota bacterium]
MGQKVHPYILRIGFGKDWQSKWFVLNKREFAQFLDEDRRIRERIRKNYPLGSIANIIIERVSANLIRIKIRTSRPGIIIGRRGQDIERLKQDIIEFTGKEIIIDVEEVEAPSLEAQLVAEIIAFQITKRVNFRRAMRRAIQQAVNLGCEGIKIRCAGRLGGVEIARSETYKQGKVPLQTFRVDVDYGFFVAKTTYGTIGVKVWIYKGDKGLGSYLKKEEEAD